MPFWYAFKMISPQQFTSICHSLARDINLRIVRIHERCRTPNFYVCELQEGGRSIFLLCTLDAHWALSDYFSDQECRLNFTDHAAIATALWKNFAIRVEEAARLHMEMDNQPDFDEKDLAYWRPPTIGAAMFNWWD